MPGNRSRLFIADLFAHFFQNPKLGGGLYVKIITTILTYPGVGNTLFLKSGRSALGTQTFSWSMGIGVYFQGCAAARAFKLTVNLKKTVINTTNYLL